MIDVDAAIVLVQRKFPHMAIQTAQPITRGWDSFVLEVNDELSHVSVASACDPSVLVTVSCNLEGCLVEM